MGQRPSKLLLLVCLVAWFSGCEKPALTPNGVVGHFGGRGLADGRFSYPRAITANDHSQVFIADKSGRIQRFSPDGEFEVGWRIPKVRAGKPVGLTIHPDGRIFVADTHYSRVLIYDQQGHLLGEFGEFGEGPGQFIFTTDIAVDHAGRIYVSEYGGNDRISKFTADYEFLSVIGAQPVAGKRLSRPAGIAIDEDQTLWVADACNHRIVRFSLDGKVLDVFGEVGQDAGQLRWPYDINLCQDGSLLVSEYGNNRLQWFDKQGRSLRTWGHSGRKLGELFSPWGAVEAANGDLFVLDSCNDRVQIVKL